MKKRSDHKGNSGISKPLLENIGKRMERWQRRTADTLNARTRLWPSLRLKVLLVFFCLLYGGCCMFLLLEAVLRANGPPVTCSPKSQAISGHITDSIDKPIINNNSNR